MIPETHDQLRRAQTDEDYLNQFIQENKRFILACAYRTVKHFVTENDDEYSIALIAFHEAVMAYDVSRGEFRSFASLVIQRRLIDYIKSEVRHADEIPVEPFAMNGDLDGEEDPSALHLEIRSREAELAGYQTDSGGTGSPGTTPVQDEIEAVQQLLRHYGFSFYDLADCSPKAQKTKQQCAQAVRILLEDPELFRKMRLTKSLPGQVICSQSRIPRKVLERHRKYIIAAAEILNGEYPLLAEYMNYIRKALDP